MSHLVFSTKTTQVKLNILKEIVPSNLFYINATIIVYIIKFTNIAKNPNKDERYSATDKCEELFSNNIPSLLLPPCLSILTLHWNQYRSLATICIVKYLEPIMYNNTQREKENILLRLRRSPSAGEKELVLIPTTGGYSWWLLNTACKCSAHYYPNTLTAENRQPAT